MKKVIRFIDSIALTFLVEQGRVPYRALNIDKAPLDLYLSLYR